MKILITGSNGQLGRNITEVLRGASFDVIDKNSKELNINNASEVKNALNKYKPAIIINCAAYTNVEAAELETKEASATNITGPKNLAKAARKQNSILIHFSTDYVFDGENNNSYLEEDITNPINFYGESKLQGEIQITKNLKKHLIIRTSWVFGKYGNNFPRTMIKNADKNSLKIVSDQYGMPTSTASISETVKEICMIVKNKGEIKYGVYHFANYPCVSWHEFACEIFNQAIQKQKIDKRPRLIKVSSQEYASKIARPKNSQLSTNKIEKEFKLKKYFWKDYIEEVF